MDGLELECANIALDIKNEIVEKARLKAIQDAKNKK